MRRIVLAAAVLAVGVASCNALLPERFAVNAPVSQMLFGRSAEAPDETLVQGRMRTAPGFSISIWADDLAGVRFLRFTAQGDLLASQPRLGRVARLARDADGDGRSDGTTALLEDLNRPHGLDLHDGWLYVGETDAVARVRFDGGDPVGAVERVVQGLPDGGNHWTRTVRVGPDGWLYVSVGSSCNVCIEEDERRAALLRFQPDGSRGEIHARGLRNAVGFDWRPESGELYATDNGRDLLGNDFPPCELNRVERGAHYGWPFANGDRVPDPDFGPGHEDRVAASRPPAHPFRAHNAPLGITFVRGDTAPESHRGAALVALHGSWNRTSKDGYKVVSLHWPENGGPIEERDFLWGFLVDDEVIGRPVDVAEGPDGAFYVSDDFAGVIWRVAAGDSGAGPAVPRRAAADGSDALAGLSAEEVAARSVRGGELWERHDCASCHDAARATAGVVPVPLAGLAARHDLPSLATRIETPTPPMPVYDLDGEQLTDLSVYLMERFR